MSRRLLGALMLALLIATPAWSWTPREGPEANIRPTFDTGYSFPGDFRDFEDGYGLGLALEIEQSQDLSFLFRMGWDHLVDRTEYVEYGYYYSYRHQSVSLMNWSVGARGYLRPGAVLRPYGELDVGIRTGNAGGADGDGFAITQRVGVAWAAFGGSGLSLDAGVNFLARQAGRSRIVPIRLGIIFR